MGIAIYKVDFQRFLIVLLNLLLLQKYHKFATKQINEWGISINEATAGLVHRAVWRNGGGCIPADSFVLN